MQGRLSPQVNGRIQAFPWSCWREEFPLAAHHGFSLMEWTLDQDRLAENPLMTEGGRAEIADLSRRHGIAVASVTGDCFMQAPFWKLAGEPGEARRRDFQAVAGACAAAGVSMIVVPLVDQGRLETMEQEDVLVSFLLEEVASLRSRRLRVAFESDLAPGDLTRFIQRLDPDVFGVNYDIGNSASLGFDPAEEIACYGDRIVGVHVKDRRRGGPSVPLGSGDADLDAVFRALGRARYAGSYILQTARATDGDHAGVLCRDRGLTEGWLTRHAA